MGTRLRDEDDLEISSRVEIDLQNKNSYQHIQILKINASRFTEAFNRRNMM